jgi:hypothetical protein
MRRGRISDLEAGFWLGVMAGASVVGLLWWLG